MSTISILTDVAQQVSIYFGIFVLTAGILGAVLNIITFLSLQTFRQSSCAFYLLTISIVNIGQLFAGLFTRIMITGFQIDWSKTSLFYCKFRYFAIQVCALISSTCFCLAITDQYFATCSRAAWQRWSNFKIAYYSTAICSVIWILHSILQLIFYVHVKVGSTDQVICVIENTIFSKYNLYEYYILSCFLPVVVTVLFGFLVYNNIQQLNYRTVPLVRRELDKQLTTMVLTQVIVNFITVLPNAIINIISTNIMNNDDPLMTAIVQFTLAITIHIYYINFAVNISNFYLFLII